MNPELEKLLREPQRNASVPADLHEAIMRNVEASRLKPRPSRAHSLRPSLARARFAYALGLVVVIGLTIMLGIQKVADQSQQVTPGELAQFDMPGHVQATWNFLDEVGTNAPALLARPITRQLDELQNQFQRTTETLLASLSAVAPPPAD